MTAEGAKLSDGSLLNVEKALKESARVLQESKQTIVLLTQTIEGMAPQARAFREFMDSEGTCTLMHAAKIVDFPEGNSGIYRYLIEKGDIYPKINHDLYPAKREYFPSEAARGKSYYVVNVGYVDQGEKKITTHVTKVTATGLDHLRRLIKKDFDLEDEE